VTLSLPVLTFHRVDDGASVTSCSPGVFQKSIAKLHGKGYRTLGLLEAAGCLRRGAPFPDHSLVITFDDGYQSVYDRAFPVLQQYGMSATVFLTVGEKTRPRPGDRLPALNGRAMLSWSEIREMHESGFEIGAHTLSHPNLPRLTVGRIETEVYQSKAVIEDVLGAPVACFAYPYGRYDGRSRGIVQRHFACACSDKLGLITHGSDPYALERVDAYYLRTDRLFDLMLTRIFPWYIRALSIPRRIRRAVQGSAG
jgi:peptidoglycan/xylan/chitin deacetylase (PgdA/CDA1 family)